MADTIENVERRKPESEGEDAVNNVNLQPITKNESSIARELSVRPEREYRELPGLRHETRDVLKQLDANLQLLEDLGGRLSFVLAEVRGLIRK